MQLPKEAAALFFVYQDCLFDYYPLVLGGVAVAAKGYVVDSLGHCAGID